MLAPKFSLQQTAETVVVTIKLPYVRVGDAEVSVDGQDFAFYCKPYLLKLHFPHALRNNEEDESHCRAVYDSDLDHGTMTLHLLKKEPGQTFEDLDLTTTLLQPVRSFDPSSFPVSSSTILGAGSNSSSSNSSSSSASPYPMGPPFIEVLHSEEYLSPPPPPTKAPDRAAATAATVAAAAAAAAATTAPSPPPPPPPPCSSPPPSSTNNRQQQEQSDTLLKPGLADSSGVRYGFNRQYHNVFTHLTNEMVVLEVLRLPNPEHTPEEGEGGREEVREGEEDGDFDGDRYLGDMVGKDEDPLYEEAMRIKPFWVEGEGGREGGWDEEEKEEVATLKNREFLWGETEEEAREGRRAVGLGLLDLLLAFVYDWRTTGGEPTVESAWTMTTLSPSLCYLETYGGRYGGREGGREGMWKVVRTFMRRVVTYPYLRVWALAEKCVEDVGGMLQGGREGRRVMLRCLLRMRQVLRRTETHYLLNRLFLDDYCVLLQSGKGEVVVRELGEAWREGGGEGGGGVKVGKEEVGLGLVELERLLEGGGGEEEEEEEEESEGEEEEEESETESEDEESSSEEEDEDEEEYEEGTTLVTALGEVSLKERGREGEEEEEDLAGDIASLSVDPKRQKLDVGNGGGGGSLTAVSSRLLVVPRDGGGEGGREGLREGGRAKAQGRARTLIEEL